MEPIVAQALKKRHLVTQVNSVPVKHSTGIRRRVASHAALANTQMLNLRHASPANKVTSVNRVPRHRDLTRQKRRVRSVIQDTTASKEPYQESPAQLAHTALKKEMDSLISASPVLRIPMVLM